MPEAKDIWQSVVPLEELPPSVKFLSLPDRSSLSDSEQQAFDYVVERDKRKFNAMPALRDRYQHQIIPWCLAMLQSPKLADLWCEFGDFYFDTEEHRDSFSDRDRELAELAIFGALRSVGGRTAAGPTIATGATSPAVEAAFEAGVNDLAPEDRELVEYVQATARGDLTRDMFEALAARMGVKTAIEYTAYVPYAIGRHLMVGAMNQLQGLREAAPLAEERVQNHFAGLREVSSFRRGEWVEGAKK